MESQAGAAQSVLLKEPEAQPIRVLLGDKPSIFRESLRALLAAHQDLEITGSGKDGGAILTLASRYRPDVIVFEPENAHTVSDVAQGLKNLGLQARLVLVASSLRSLAPDVQTSDTVRVVPRSSTSENLLDAIRNSASKLPALVRRTRGPQALASGASREEGGGALLSRREREIVGLVAQGYRNREVADKLFISEQTVKNHMHNIFDKVRVQDRLELALYAVYHNLYT